MNKIKLLGGFVIFVSIFVSNALAAEGLIDGLNKPYKAKEIIGIEGWKNSKPLKISELKDKVVLIDFWTYSCINCLRTLPYINKWDETYRDKGLVIIGIHSPEFEFEKNPKNVGQAIERYKIKYPVAMDNYLSTWATYKNKYWPAHYLIDKEGNVVYTQFGEGNYEITEHNIRHLLGIEEKTEEKEEIEEKSPFSIIQTPETYLGYLRSQNFYSPQKTVEKITEYSFPNSLPNNSWALSGKWTIEEQKIVSKDKGAKIRLNFSSKKVFLVMGLSKSTKAKSIQISLKLNDQELPNSPITVDKHMLYELVDQEKPSDGMLELTAAEAGLEAYVFTFGQ